MNYPSEVQSEDYLETTDRSNLEVDDRDDEATDKVVLMWLMWGIILAVVATFCSVVFVSILLNKQARSSVFNQYLLCLMIPDITMSTVCCINCFLNVHSRRFVSLSWCHFQAFYMVWGIAANSWMNGIIAREVYCMLKKSNQRERYFPPKTRTVITQAVCVYVYAAMVSAAPIIGLDWLPHKVGRLIADVCLPMYYDWQSGLFFFCIFLPMFALLPLLYVVCITYDVFRHGLLPTSGKTRHLAIYFIRLIFVFAIMWLPSLVCLFVVSDYAGEWLVWSAAAWSHLQGLASASVSLMKPDVSHAVTKLLTCNLKDDEISDSRRWMPSGLGRSTVKIYSSRASITSLVPIDVADLPSGLYDDDDESTVNDNKKIANASTKYIVEDKTKGSTEDSNDDVENQMDDDEEAISTSGLNEESNEFHHS